MQDAPSPSGAVCLGANAAATGSLAPGVHGVRAHRRHAGERVPRAAAAAPGHGAARGGGGAAAVRPIASLLLWSPGSSRQASAQLWNVAALEAHRPLCLPHCTVSPNVSPSPRWISHCLSHCVSHRLPRCVSHCVPTRGGGGGCCGTPHWLARGKSACAPGGGYKG
jgi:hypothetical protein